MKVYAFVGPSGTGKSHRVQWVAKEHGIECIIDDGLLIKGNKVIAGSSAKKEDTKIASIKRALFTDYSHAREVREAIKIYDPESIIILGTSDEMVSKIAAALELPEISDIIRIQDVATEEEINMALSIRKDEGKHVIPVPTFEIKNNFSGYFLDPLKFFKPKNNNNELPFIADKSVVRPTFSYLGKYIISDNVINNMVDYIITHVEGVYKTVRSRVTNMPAGAIIDIEVSIEYGCYIPDVLNAIQEKVCEEMERLTALNIIYINVTAKTLHVDQS
ncbi:MAG: Asp23/Gls24 family envelope stress response protein [Deltaproteobacteria bacterium]